MTSEKIIVHLPGRDVGKWIDAYYWNGTMLTTGFARRRIWCRFFPDENDSPDEVSLSELVESSVIILFPSLWRVPRSEFADFPSHSTPTAYQYDRGQGRNQDDCWF